jgi:hypothetical protein
MKREELTPIDLECNMGPDVNGVVHREPWKAYDIDEVDILIDMKYSEINELRDECAELHNRVATLLSQIRIRDERIDELKAELETVQESAYADSVDAGMLERRLRRALWLARANNAINSYDKWNLFANFESEDKLFTIDEYDETPGVTDFSTLRTYAKWCKVWQNVGRKCLKKAELYK